MGKANINYESCNRDSRDLLYIGIDSNAFRRICTRIPGISARQITNYAELKSYLQDRMILFSITTCGGMGIGRATAENAIYPATMLSEPEIPSGKEEGGEYDGVEFIKQTKKHLIHPVAFVFLPESTFTIKEPEIQRRCSEKEVQFVRESELITRVNDFVMRQRRD